MHGKLHISVCGLFMYTGRRPCSCLSLIRRAYAFRFTGDRREFIFLSSPPPPPRLLLRVATVYEGTAKGTGGILPSSLCLSEQVTMLWEGG